MTLENLTVAELREASVELDNQIRSLRARRLEIAREIEARYPETEAADPQVVAPGFVESESEAISPASKRRGWRNRH